MSLFNYADVTVIENALNGSSRLELPYMRVLQNSSKHDVYGFAAIEYKVEGNEKSIYATISDYSIKLETLGLDRSDSDTVLYYKGKRVSNNCTRIE